MAELVRIRLGGFLQLQAGVKAGTAVLRRPFAGKRGRDVLRAVRRKATDSVEAQFRSKRYVGLGGSTYSWKTTGPFGRRPAPKSTMESTGKYKRAFLGGPGKFERITDNLIVFGVDESVFPQEKLHQKATPTRIRANASNRTPRGHLKMQMVLLGRFGLFFSEKFLLGRGFLMQPRKVGMNRSMAVATVEVLEKAFYDAIRGRAR